MNLNVENCSSIAIVGPSGCGKSTLLQLLQRLYDPKSGNIYLDDENISRFVISALRHQIGIVSQVTYHHQHHHHHHHEYRWLHIYIYLIFQEPVLFDRTIFENIAYGDNSRKITEREIINAAKSANIHDFISSLPLGYETKVGTGGGHLSGGQKQRIAIARALVGNKNKNKKKRHFMLDAWLNACGKFKKKFNFLITGKKSKNTFIGWSDERVGCWKRIRRSKYVGWSVRRTNDDNGKSQIKRY